MSDFIPELTISNLFRGFFFSSYLSFLTGLNFLWTLSLICLAGAIALTVYKFTRPYDEKNVPLRGPVPKGKTRICVAGYNSSAPTAKAHYLADLIARRYPDKYSTWYYWDFATGFGEFVKRLTEPMNFKELGCEHIIGQDMSPFCFLEFSSGEKKCLPIGSSTELSKWARKEFPNDKEILELANTKWGLDWYITGKAFHTGVGRPSAIEN